MRKIETEEEARRCLAAVAAAGEDAVGWARAHDVDARSLNAWRVNLGRRDANAETSRPAAFVELVPAPATARARYAVVVGDARVEFGDDFSGDTLRRVLEVLAC